VGCGVASGEVAMDAIVEPDVCGNLEPTSEPDGIGTFSIAQSSRRVRELNVRKGVFGEDRCSEWSNGQNDFGETLKYVYNLWQCIDGI